MKRIIILLLLVSISLSATHSIASPKEGDSVLFTGSFASAHDENVTFYWDLDSRLPHPATCSFDGSVISCSITMVIPSDRLDKTVVYYFQRDVLGTKDSGVFETQDMILTATTPASANINSVITVPVSILWEDSTVPPPQTVIINSTALSINEFFLNSGTFSRDLSIPKISSGVYKIDFNFVHGTTTRTITKNIEVKGTTTGEIESNSVAVTPSSYSESKSFTINVVANNLGSSKMSNTKLKVNLFGTVSEYNCNIINPSYECANLFSLTLPPNKIAGEYSIPAELTWTNDDGTIFLISS